MEANKQRAERAYLTLLYYGQDIAQDDVEENLIDFLADCLHLAPDYDIDLGELLQSAQIHYDAEKPEEAA